MIIEERSKHSAVFSKKRDLRDLRVLKGPEHDFYIIVIKLSSVDSVRAFVSEFHNKKFNLIEPDLCQVFTLESVRFQQDIMIQTNDHNSSP